MKYNKLISRMLLCLKLIYNSSFIPEFHQATPHSRSDQTQ